MSFSKSVKEEISKTENLANKEAVKYELVGYLLSSNVNISNKEIKFNTENEYNINRFSRLLSNMGINNYNISIQGKIFTIELKTKDLKEINLEKIEIEKLKEEQMKWLIKGAYLGAGSINNPQNKYHLELGIKTQNNAKSIIDILQKTYDIKSSMIEKKNEYSIYIKDGEEISKFLALLGANKSVLQFEEIRVQREMNNKINRIVNCESANLSKTINASIEQIEAIKKLKKKHKFEKMSEPLKEIAMLRLNNPNASLIELGQMLKEPVGKSGVNYRLKKIIELAGD